MSETAPDRRSRRGGGRDARRQLRSNSATAAMPYIVRQLEPFDILSDESAEIIENNDFNYSSYFVGEEKLA